MPTSKKLEGMTETIGKEAFCEAGGDSKEARQNGVNSKDGGI